MNSSIEQNHKKTALIIGCNGTFGNAIGLELLKQDWHVKALLRNERKCPNWLAEADTYIGDCRSIETLEKASDGVDVLVYGANPLYHQWQDKAESMIEASVKVAEKHGLHILFPGNVYGYNPQSTALICEQSKGDAVTEKGRIRIAMENRLHRATQNGATVTVIRSGDFIAKNANSSWFNHLLIKKNNRWLLNNPSPIGHQHCYSWLPDLATNAVALLALDKKGFNVWHEAGLLASHQDWLHALQGLNLQVDTKPFPWWQLTFIGLFNPSCQRGAKNALPLESLVSIKCCQNARGIRKQFS